MHHWFSLNHQKVSSWMHCPLALACGMTVWSSLLTNTYVAQPITISGWSPLVLHSGMYSHQNTLIYFWCNCNILMRISMAGLSAQASGTAVTDCTDIKRDLACPCSSVIGCAARLYSIIMQLQFYYIRSSHVMSLSRSKKISVEIMQAHNHSQKT